MMAQLPEVIALKDKAFSMDELVRNIEESFHRRNLGIHSGVGFNINSDGAPLVDPNDLTRVTSINLGAGPSNRPDRRNEFAPPTEPDVLASNGFQTLAQTPFNTPGNGGLTTKNSTTQTIRRGAPDTTWSDAATLTEGTVSGGLAGSIFGPIGVAVGGALGLVGSGLSLIGKNNAITEQKREFDLNQEAINSRGYIAPSQTVEGYHIFNPYVYPGSSNRTF